MFDFFNDFLAMKRQCLMEFFLMADKETFIHYSQYHGCWWTGNGPLARSVKLRVTHAPGMPGTFSPQPLVNDLDMHHGTCVMHVPWCMPGSLTSGFLWSRWRGKRSQHSRRMRNRQFYVSGKRPMTHNIGTHGIHQVYLQHSRFSTRKVNVCNGRRRKRLV